MNYFKAHWKIIQRCDHSSYYDVYRRRFLFWKLVSPYKESLDSAYKYISNQINQEKMRNNPVIHTFDRNGDML